MVVKMSYRGGSQDMDDDDETTAQETTSAGDDEDTMDTFADSTQPQNDEVFLQFQKQMEADLRQQQRQSLGSYLDNTLPPGSTQEDKKEREKKGCEFCLWLFLLIYMVIFCAVMFIGCLYLLWPNAPEQSIDYLYWKGIRGKKPGHARLCYDYKKEELLIMDVSEQAKCKQLTK